MLIITVSVHWSACKKSDVLRKLSINGKKCIF